jgi:hypothetical protein
VSEWLAARPQLPQLVLLAGAIAFAFMARAHALRPKTAVRVSSPRSPGFAARWRARRGVRHPRQGWAVGYRSALGSASLTWAEFRLGGLMFGAPGSGKTTALQLIAQATAAAGSAGVFIDPKGSRELRRTVAALGGIVWTIGGPVKWDPLEADPEVMAEQLLEGEPIDKQAPGVFRGGARLAMQQLGRALTVAGSKPDVDQVVGMLRSGKWQDVVRQRLGKDYVPLTEHERDGVRTFAAGLAGLLLGPAGRSLGSGPECLRLRETVAQRKIVLFSLDAGSYPDTSRRIAGWVFLGVKALLGERLDTPGPPCIVAVDEAHRVGWTGRLAVDLLATGREAQVPVVLASQGPSDLDELGHHLLERSVQDAAWTLIFRQGTLDSERASRILGQRQVEERTWMNDGRETVRLVDKETVPARVLEDLQPGTAWLRVPPVERKRARVECVRVAMPATLPLARSSLELGTATETVAGTAVERQGTDEVPAPASPLPRAKAAAVERVWSLVQRRGERECWPIVFPEGVKGTDSYGYPRMKVGGKYVKTYHLVYEERNGEMGDDEGVDHVCHNRDASCPGGRECPHKMCHNLAHLQGVSSEENTRRRHEWARRRERARANGLEVLK